MRGAGVLGYLKGIERNTEVYTVNYLVRTQMVFPVIYMSKVQFGKIRYTTRREF